MRSATPIQNILDGATANGAGTGINVEDLEHIMLAIDTADSTNATIKIQGSIADDEPAWASAQAQDNQWDNIQIKDLEDASAVDGDVGLALSGTDDHRIFEVNVNGLKWLNAIVSSYVAGTIYVRAKGFKDE